MRARNLSTTILHVSGLSKRIGKQGKYGFATSVSDLKDPSKRLHTGMQSNHMEGAGQALSFSGTLRAYIVMQLMIIIMLMTRSETNPVPREPQIASLFPE